MAEVYVFVSNKILILVAEVYVFVSYKILIIVAEVYVFVSYKIIINISKKSTNGTCAHLTFRAFLRHFQSCLLSGDL